MNRLISFLGILLAMQLLLAVFFGMTNRGVSGVAGSEPLLHFEANGVEKISIEQPKKASLVINRRENRWLLPALSDFPAFTSKVDGFLGRLAGLRKQLPLSTTVEAVKRFKVSPSIYEHKVVLSSGDKVLATLWLGDSAGLRQVYARANEEDTVYNLDFATYEISSDPNQWADKMVLNLKADEITQVTLPDVNLVRIKEHKPEEKKEAEKDGNSEKWQMEGLAPEEKLNHEEIETFINRIANLSFDAVLGKENQTKYHQDTPLLTLSITTRTGEPRTYVFSALEKEVKSEKSENSEKGENAGKITEYILKSSNSPYYFKLAEFMVKELLETKRDKLIKTTKVATSEKSEPAPPPDSSTEESVPEMALPEETKVSP